MAKRALVDNRPWLLASIIAAIAFYVLRDTALGGFYLAIVKGAAVGALASYALRRSRSQQGVLIAAVMAVSALADIAIEFSFTAGGALFFVAHLIAITLYLRHPRARPTGSQKLAGGALLLLSPLLAWVLTKDWAVALYSVALGGMAASAWWSLFPRYRVGLGAVLFVASDMLIFSQFGPYDLAPVPQYAIWPLYYFGQFLICTGVIQTLRRDHKV